MHYEISVTQDPRFVHEMWEKRRDRVMGATIQSTFAIYHPRRAAVDLKTTRTLIIDGCYLIFRA